MDVPRCLSSLRPGFNFRPWQSISRGSSRTDHTLPNILNQHSRKWLNLPQRHYTTCGLRGGRPKFNHGQTMAEKNTVADIVDARVAQTVKAWKYNPINDQCQEWSRNWLTEFSTRRFPGCVINRHSAYICLCPICWAYRVQNENFVV